MFQMSGCDYYNPNFPMSGLPYCRMAGSIKRQQKESKKKQKTTSSKMRRKQGALV
jgi:hypothetical protein